MSRPRVLIADDHAMMIDGLRRILERDFEVVGAVEDGRALLAAARLGRADVYLVDISMPLMNGIEATRRTLALRPEARVVILTMHPDGAYAASAFEAGAMGYVVKSAAATELIAALRAVLAGGRARSRRHAAGPRHACAALRAPARGGAARRRGPHRAPDRRPAAPLAEDRRVPQVPRDARAGGSCRQPSWWITRAATASRPEGIGVLRVLRRPFSPLLALRGP